MGAFNILVGPWGGVVLFVAIVVVVLVRRRVRTSDLAPEPAARDDVGLGGIDLDALLIATRELVEREPLSPRSWMSHADAALLTGRLDVALDAATQALGLAHGDEDREALAQAKATAAYTLAVMGEPEEMQRANRLVSEAAEVLSADREMGAVLARLGDADAARPHLVTALSGTDRPVRRHPLHAFLALGELSGGDIGTAAGDAANMRAEGDWPGPLAQDVRLRLGAAVAVALIGSAEADGASLELRSRPVRETAQWAVRGWLDPTDPSPIRWRAFAAQGGSIEALTPDAMRRVLAWSEAAP